MTGLDLSSEVLSRAPLLLRQGVSTLSGSARTRPGSPSRDDTMLQSVCAKEPSVGEDVADGSFDPITMVVASEHAPRAGLAAVAVRERAFVPTELNLLFRMAGVSVLNMWGGTAGNWGRRLLDLDEFEIMIVGCKTGEPLAAGAGA